MSPKRSALGRFAPWVAVAVGAATFLFRPSPSWVESTYANGLYARWEHLLFPLSNALPWSLGDLAVLLGVAVLLFRVVRLSRSSRRRGVRRGARIVLEIAAVICVYFAWFEASWGWNYDRSPVETRLDYQASRVNSRAVEALRARAIAEMNRLAAVAHKEPSFSLGTLYAAWLPVVQAGGDRWAPLTGAPKTTLADPFMNATGTSGFINPLTLNVQLASDLLPFERPFSLAHEWSHVAAYAREDEANYLAILACTRSSDPLIAYSGWLELFLYLPAQARYPKKTFVPQVWADFAAIRKRNAERINARLASMSWHTYNVYLKSNHIASGVMNYNEVTRLYLGVPLDAAGLPETPRAVISR